MSKIENLCSKVEQDYQEDKLAKSFKQKSVARRLNRDLEMEHEKTGLNSQQQMSLDLSDFSRGAQSRDQQVNY
jgi:predicted hydrolase (HD superfamily)